MGVSGSGKTTIGQALAHSLGWTFLDADAFHSPEAVAKMAAGIPLDDHDRDPWLAALAAEIARRRRIGAPAVIACSALKARYRSVLTGQGAEAPGDVGLVYLKGPPGLIRARLAARSGHFMPEHLLDSQFEALEEPRAAEGVLIVGVEGPPETVLNAILAGLSQGAPQDVSLVAAPTVP
jgi:gluconokinase